MTNLLSFLDTPPEPLDETFAAELRAGPDFNEMISEACRRRMLSAAQRLQYKTDFTLFKDFCSQYDVDPLTAAGPVVAMWLAGLTDEPHPLKRICDALDAIDYYRWLTRRDCYADAVILAAAAEEADGGVKLELGNPADEDDKAAEPQKGLN